MPCHRECRWFNPIGFVSGVMVGTCLRDPPPDAYDRGLGDGDAVGCADFTPRIGMPIPSACPRRVDQVPLGADLAEGLR